MTARRDVCGGGGDGGVSAAQGRAQAQARAVEWAGGDDGGGGDGVVAAQVPETALALAAAGPRNRSQLHCTAKARQKNASWLMRRLWSDAGCACRLCSLAGVN